jgi:hypothetical protein
MTSPTPRALEKARAWLSSHSAVLTTSREEYDLAALLDEARAEGVREGLENAARICHVYEIESDPRNRIKCETAYELGCRIRKLADEAGR